MNHQNKYYTILPQIFILMIFICIIFPTQSFATNFIPNTAFSNDMFINMLNEVDSRIASTTANNTTKSLWTVRGDATNPWVRNPDVWTSNGIDIDWTGASPWNSGGGYTKAGTLISPRHLVFANHYQIDIGATIVFVTNDNQIITRTLTGKANIAGTDIMVGILNTVVPESIMYYPVLDILTWKKYLKDGVAEAIENYNVPSVSLDQEDHVLVKGISKMQLFQTADPRIVMQPSTGKRLEFDEVIEGGDSGNPSFVIIGGIPVLLMTQWSTMHGSSNSHNYNQLNVVMDQLSGFDEYNLSSLDFSVINAPFVISETQDFSAIENSPAGTVVGTTSVEYNVENDTMYSSIVSGNADGALSIDATTGVIRVASSTLVHRNNNFPRIISLKISENDANGRASFATTSVYIRAQPSFLNPPYSFNLDENKANETVVGSTIIRNSYDGSITYSILSGNTNNAFKISSSTGEIRVNDTTILDFETTPVFNLTVEAIENYTVEHFAVTTPVTISLNNMSVRFGSLQYFFTLPQNVSDGYIIGSPATENEDISILHYSIVSGNENNIFSISTSTGEISLHNKSGLNYNLKNRYVLNIGVSNQGSISTILATTLVDIDIPSSFVPAVPVSVSSGGGGGGGSYTPSPVQPPKVQDSITTPLAVLPNTIVPVIPVATISSLGNNVRDLQINVKGNDVKTLQQFLNFQGFAVSKIGAGSPGKETTLFGPATKAALIKFQAKNGIKPASGYFGPKTKAFIKTLAVKSR